jgi:xanthine dehydrogenase accessory factor
VGALLGWALDTPAFYIGAQGGLRGAAGAAGGSGARWAGAGQAGAITSPVGLIPRTREPGCWRSALAEIMGATRRFNRRPE